MIVSKNTVIYIASLFFFFIIYSSCFPQQDTIPWVKDSVLNEAKIVPVTGRQTTYDPAQDRLFFTATGTPMPAGEFQASFHSACVKEVGFILFPHLNIGVTNFASIGAGISITPVFGVYMFNAKITPLNLDVIKISAGAFLVGYTGGGGVAGIVYGAGTVELSPASLTGGLAWSTVESDFSKTPILILGCQLNVANNFKFMSENWLGFHSYGTDIFSVNGGRLILQKAAIDLGLGLFSPASKYSEPDLLLMPVVSFTVSL